MTQARPKFSTFEEYLDYDDGTENRYELVDGELLEVTPTTPEHSDIAEWLDRVFYQEVQRLGHDWRVKRGDVGVRTSGQRSRLPDVCVLEGHEWRKLRQQKSKSAVLQVPLLMAVEIVSPGRKNRDRDYKEKRQEYQNRGIPEYWIIDPEEAKLTRLLLVEGEYEEEAFLPGDSISPKIFPELVLKVERILAGA